MIWRDLGILSQYHYDYSCNTVPVQFFGKLATSLSSWSTTCMKETAAGRLLPHVHFEKWAKDLPWWKFRTGQRSQLWYATLSIYTTRETKDFNQTLTACLYLLCRVRLSHKTRICQLSHQIHPKDMININRIWQRNGKQSKSPNHH